MKWVVFYGSGFESSARKLEKKLKNQLVKQIDFLESDPFHSKLHTKPLTGELSGFYSFRIGRDYRVIFFFKEKAEIHLVKVAKRDEIYNR